MSSDKILSEKFDGIGLLTFNNPERHNAVSLDMWDSVEACLEDFIADDAIRVVVITAAGRPNLDFSEQNRRSHETASARPPPRQ